MHVALPRESGFVFFIPTIASQTCILLDTPGPVHYVRGQKLGSIFDRLAALFYRFVRKLRNQKKLREIGIGDLGKRIQVLRHPRFRDGLTIPP